MPLIKDRDRYKKLTRRENKLVGKPEYPVNKITNKTLRDKEEASDNRKSEAILKAQAQPSVDLTITKSLEDDGGANVIGLLTLDGGASLINILITNTTSGNLVFDLHWGFTERSQLTFTTSSGLISGVTGGETAALVMGTLNAYSTVSLNNLFLNTRGVSDTFVSAPLDGGMFSNIRVPIHFYFVCRSTGLDITCSTSS